MGNSPAELKNFGEAPTADAELHPVLTEYRL